MSGGKPARWLLAAAFVLVATGLGPNDAATAHSRLAAFGDSYVNPSLVGWREGQRTWVSSLGEPVRNLGHAGDGVADTLARARRTAGTTFELVVIAVGINDVCRSGTDPARLARFRDDYEQLRMRFSSARRVVVVPPLPVRSCGVRGSEAALGSYRDVVLELAAGQANVRVADPLPSWQPETMLMSDGLHPNAAGRAAIAGAVRDALSAP